MTEPIRCEEFPAWVKNAHEQGKEETIISVYAGGGEYTLCGKIKPMAEITPTTLELRDKEFPARVLDLLRRLIVRECDSFQTIPFLWGMEKVIEWSLMPQAS